MTHGHFSGWCSAEADAPAVTNMESMDIMTFGNKVQALSTIMDKTTRDAEYATVLTTLHNEAIFLPLTAKRQTAVTSTAVDNFQFGYLEFDLPLANLKPKAPPSAAAGSEGALIGVIIAVAAVAGLLLIGMVVLIHKEKKGTPIFTSLDVLPKGHSSGVGKVSNTAA